MPVGSSLVSESGPPLAISRPSAQDISSFDARWAAWIARGRDHDVAVNRNLGDVVLGVAVIGVLAILVYGFAEGAR